MELRWGHWLAVLVWLVTFFWLHREIRNSTLAIDPFLLPAGALLTGWGVLTIWRLDAYLGARQTIWLAFSALAFAAGLRKSSQLQIVRQYKYLLLSVGLLLTASTLIFGTNPAGAGPRLWIGCCGLYFQPSEPLKLLLVLYLAAYLSERKGIGAWGIPLVLPTIIVTSLALVILLVQQDLGTASLFILLYATVLYVATDRARVLAGAFIGLGLALALGYATVDLIHVRVDAWLDPWRDAAGGSYQIVQGLLAVANGGLLGRGPGIGSPGLVPVAASDSIYVAIAEETGLAGTLGLLGTIGVILARGVRAAVRGSDSFRRLLAIGATAYLGLQSLLILGGSLRLLPLTGVTLPFVSYGGSSLLTSFGALLLLILSSTESSGTSPSTFPSARPKMIFLTGLLASLMLAGLAAGWWAVVRGQDILRRTDNARRSIADRYVERGRLLDRNDEEINVSDGIAGNLERKYLVPELAAVIGYTHPVFGQAGLEASLDDYLRGLLGNPLSAVIWEQLVYGTPPKGIDVRLSLDLRLQSIADARLGSRAGAAVLMNADTGEILVMASHPFVSQSALDTLAQSPSAADDGPLVNRATQGAYPANAAIAPLIRAASGQDPATEEDRARVLEAFGLSTAPQLRAPVAPSVRTFSSSVVQVTPLQMAVAASTLSNHGRRAAPRIAIAVDTPQQGWIILPSLAEPSQALPSTRADLAAESLAGQGVPYWQHESRERHLGKTTTWALFGTVPSWQATRIVCVVVLEEDDLPLARSIGSALMQGALGR